MHTRTALDKADNRIRELVYEAESLKEWLRNMLRECDRSNLSEVRAQLVEALRKIG